MKRREMATSRSSIASKRSETYQGMKFTEMSSARKRKPTHVNKSAPNRLLSRNETSK